MKAPKNHILALELKRSFTSPGFWIALILGSAAILPHIFIALEGYFTYFPLSDQFSGYYDGSAYSQSFTMYSSFTYFERYYYYCVPLLAVLPHGASFYQDLRSGYARNMLSRTTRKNYLQAKYWAAFLSGGAVVLLPVIADFLIMTLFHPLSVCSPQILGVPFPDCLLIKVYYSHPFFYFLFFWTVLFTFCGLAATLSLLISYFTDFVFSVIASPFLLALGWYVIGYIAHILPWVPTIFVQAYQAYEPLSLPPILIVLSGMFLLTYVLFLKLGTRKEIW